MLIPSRHVTDSRIRNLVFANLLYQYFFWFPIINYGGDSSVLKIKIIIFIRIPVVAPIVTDGDSTRDLLESQTNFN